MLSISGRVVVLSILRYLSVTAIICLFLVVPEKADAMWPFGASEKEPYIAKIDDYVITGDYFARSVNSLHSSKEAGKALAGKALGRESSFAIVDFSKHLNNVIDTKLMVFEAERLGLNKEAEYLSQLRSFKLNLLLGRLRREEILDKVKVDDEEIEQYLEEARKEEEALRKAAEKEKDASEQKNDADEAVPDEVSEQDLEVVAEEESKADAHGKKRTARGRIYAEKVQKREVEYFDSLRRKARVKIYDDALKVIMEDGEELPVDVIDATVVAKIDGETIGAFEFMINVKRAGRDFSDEDALREELDMLILHKLLDKAAFAKNYEKKIPDLRHRIGSYSDKRLVGLFKRKVIAPIVKVSDEAILKYYNENQDKFVRSDSFNISTITVVGEESAQELLEDLKSGADFAYIAETMSIDPSKDTGGELGWVLKDSLPTVVMNEIVGAKKGDIVGPFKGEYGYFVIMLNDFKSGELVPLVEVKDAINKRLGRDVFKDTLKEYILRMRNQVSIEINEDVLRRFNEGKR